MSSRTVEQIFTKFHIGKSFQKDILHEDLLKSYSEERNIIVMLTFPNFFHSFLFPSFLFLFNFSPSVPFFLSLFLCLPFSICLRFFLYFFIFFSPSFSLFVYFSHPPFFSCTLLFFLPPPYNFLISPFFFLSLCFCSFREFLSNSLFRPSLSLFPTFIEIYCLFSPKSSPT